MSDLRLLRVVSLLLLQIVIGVTTSPTPVLPSQAALLTQLDPLVGDDGGGVLSAYPSYIRTKREGEDNVGIDSGSDFVAEPSSLVVGVGSAVNMNTEDSGSLVEFRGGRMVRTRRTGAGSIEGSGGGEMTGVEKVIDRYRPVKKLDYSHPYRKKVKPVEKPITPYFVRILKRRPVGPSAMNYTTENTFENSDNGEIIDVPKVLVDRRRNKNVDSIHPIYVVENDDDEQQQNQDYQRPASVQAGKESVVFIPTSEEPSSTTPSTTTTTTTLPTTTEPPPTERVTTIPVVKFRRLMRFRPTTTIGQDYTTVEEEQERTTSLTTTTTTTEAPQTTEPVYYREYTDYDRRKVVQAPNNTSSDNIDYLPLEYDQYDKDHSNGSSDYPSVRPLSLVSTASPPTAPSSTYLPPQVRPYPPDHHLADEEDHHHNHNHHRLVSSKKRVLPQLQPSPETVVFLRVRFGEDIGGSERLPVPISQVRTTLSTTTVGPPSVFGDYGYGGVVIGGGVRDRATMDDVTTEALVEDITNTTTTVAPTTTTTTTEQPTTTTSTTTTTIPPTTTRTTEPPPPTTTEPPLQTSTTDVTSTMTDEELLAHLLTYVPKDSDPNQELTKEQATTLQEMMLQYLLTASTTPTPDAERQVITGIPKFTRFPTNEFPDLQTSASTTTGFFSTRADVGGQAVTTRNPLLQFFDNLAGNSNNQQRSAPSSFVRPIQEGGGGGLIPQPQAIVQQTTKQDIGGGNSGGGGDGMAQLIKMMIQLPGNILVGVLRFMRSTGEFLGGVMNGVMKMLGGLSGGASSSSSAGGLFGG